ncbi:class I SAM-dependent methyltransferase [Halobacteriales archaeon SW_7_65_23]|nr:MAG: class I SAM-dependent methyltransferase [Halobacteriales archaeon SW_7_65_23]
MNDAERAALAEQYADADNLDARIRLHERYDTADRDWWRWVFDHYEGLPDGADLLEVGCGTGYLWRDNADRIPDGWGLLLTDFSAGMADDARATLAEAGVDAAVGVAAAESLPLPDDSVDAVVANHMLYHVDRDAALPELHRVLRPGGRLFATTNSEANMLELRELLRAATTYEPASVEEFSLEGGADELGRHFAEVRRSERGSALHVPDLEPLVAYAASLPGVTDEQVAEFGALADDRLADGPLEIRKSMGLFIARTR